MIDLAGGDGSGDAKRQPRYPFPPDTWAAVGGGGSTWTKGVLFVNGHNAGWYWPARGPQNTLFLPGPWLAYGENEVILVEVEVGVRAGRTGLPKHRPWPWWTRPITGARMVEEGWWWGADAAGSEVGRTG